MKFRFVLSALAAFFAGTIFLTTELTAQTKNNLVPSGPAQVAKVDADNTIANHVTNASASADPAAVKNYSENELNDLFEQMTSHYSRDAILFNNIGAAYFNLKMFDKAESALRRAVVINNHPAFLTNLSIVYDQQGRTSEAVTAAQRAIAQSPRYMRARTQLCELMLVSKRDDDAVLCYDETSKIGPMEPIDQTYYAIGLVRTKNFDKAIDLLAPLASGRQPLSSVSNTLGFAYFMKKKYKLAAEAFKQAVEIDPDNPKLRYNLALSLTAANNRAGALSQYSLMKEKDPDLAGQLYKYLYRDKMIFVDEQTAAKNPR